MSLPIAHSDHDSGAFADVQLRFDDALPREIVHKRSAREVFVTDIGRVGPDLFALGGRLPSSHAFFNDTAAPVDVMTLMELGRQSAYVVGHRYLGIPIDAKYVVRSMRASLDPALEGLELPRPTPVVLAFRVLRTFGAESQVTGFELAVEFRLPGGGAIGAFSGSCSWMPPPRWRSLRAAGREELGLAPEPRLPGRDPETVPAGAVGRSVAGNAVLARPRLDGEEALADLAADPSHVPLFDHAHHHVPGVVLVEGARQLAIWAAARRFGLTAAADLEVRGVASQFAAVAEFDLPTRLRGRIAPAGDAPGLRVHVDLLQGERLTGASEIDLVVRGA